MTKGFEATVRLLLSLHGHSLGPQPLFPHIGEPIFRRVRQFPNQTVDNQSVVTPCSDSKVADLIKQIRRLQNLISMLRKDIMRDASTHRQALNRTWAQICQFAHHHEFPITDQLSTLLSSPLELSFKQIALTTKLLSLYQQHHQRWADNANKDARAAWRARQKESKHQKAAFQHISPPSTPALVALKRSDGTFATAPDDMDALLRQTWAPVYQGNVSYQLHTVAAYIRKYARYIYIYTARLRPHYHL